MATPALSDENTLGPYRLIRKLGEGGMGTVYLGYDDQLARHVAIKVLRADSGKNGEPASATLARRFLREAQSAARINHPCAVTIHAVGQHAGQPFMVMEYLDGGSLADELRTAGPLSWRESLPVISGALLGLAAAHHAGVIHRDIKPANIMRAGTTTRGDVKLVDFGLARVVYGPSESEITFPGAFVGSPSYASPEQAAGVVRLDARSDLYSLAATWYALLTGQPPFVDDDPAEVMRLHITTPFPDPGALAPDIPDELIAVLRRAAEKDPAARYMGAEDMHKAVAPLSALREKRTPPAPSRVPVKAQVKADETIAHLEHALADARKKSDSSSQLSTLCSLYGLYHQLNRRDQALQAFREAMVLHVKIQAPHAHA